MNVPWLGLVFCCFAMVCATDAIFILCAGAFLLIYWVRKATNASKSFSYLSECTMTATVVDNLSFDPLSSPWYPYSIRLPRIIWSWTCQSTCFSQFNALFFLSRSAFVMPSQLLTLLHWHGLGPGVDGIKCPSAVPLGLVQFDMGMQVYIFTDLIKDVIDSSIIYLILWHNWMTDCTLCLLYFLSCLRASVASWHSFCPQELLTKGSHSRYDLLWSFL